MSVTRKDCVRQTFRGSGPGGQHRNKKDTGVRFIHEPSGARGEASEMKSQRQNEKLAWRRMAESKEMQYWLRRQGGLDLLIEAEVERQMRPHNLLIEGKDEDGRWSADAIDTEVASQ